MMRITADLKSKIKSIWIGKMLFVWCPEWNMFSICWGNDDVKVLYEYNK